MSDQLNVILGNKDIMRRPNPRPSASNQDTSRPFLIQRGDVVVLMPAETPSQRARRALNTAGGPDADRIVDCLAEAENISLKELELCIEIMELAMEKVNNRIAKMQMRKRR